MTLTNEQRAHDLAIATLPIKYDINKVKHLNLAENESKQGNDITVDISFDGYIEYIKLYNAYLSAFNE